MTHHAPDGPLAAICRSVRVAAGVFAPGHLGALTPIIDFGLIDDLLEATRTRDQRIRALPRRVGVYFILALCLFSEVGYSGVWARMNAGLGPLAPPPPTHKALGDLRRRIGPAPLKALATTLFAPLGRPTTPGCRYAGYRLVSFDGCNSQKVPDTRANRAWLGRAAEHHSYPALELMTLVETGTRALLGAVFGPLGPGETTYARMLLGHLDSTMLVLWDRGFDGNDFLAEVASTGARFVGRVRSGRRPRVLTRLADGSYLSRINGVAVRIISAEVHLRGADGSAYTAQYRVATTLLDHRAHPAARVIELYHQRWEHESAYHSLRATLMQGRVLRSGDRVGLEQEVWALLACYQVLRIAMADAAHSVPGTDPDRMSFSLALHTAREQIITAEGIVPQVVGVCGPIEQRLAAQPLPARRMRISLRKVKCPVSRYHARRADERPVRSCAITALSIAVVETGPAGPADDDRERARPGPGRSPRAQTALQHHPP